MPYDNADDQSREEFGKMAQPNPTSGDRHGTWPSGVPRFDARPYAVDIAMTAAGPYRYSINGPGGYRRLCGGPDDAAVDSADLNAAYAEGRRKADEEWICENRYLQTIARAETAQLRALRSLCEHRPPRLAWYTLFVVFASTDALFFITTAIMGKASWFSLAGTMIFVVMAIRERRGIRSEYEEN